MQFLQPSEHMRRRLFLEELLLMLLRIAVIAALVLALAGPQLTAPWLPAAARPPRAVVLLLDGSASMAAAADMNSTPHEAARRWARTFLDGLQPGDAVAVFQVKHQPESVVADLSRDLDWVRGRLDDLPAPAGACRWPVALQHAHDLLKQSTAARRDIIVLTDNQRQGWADPATLAAWEKHSPRLRDVPITVVNLAADRPAAPPNFALAPLHTTPAVPWPGREVTFQTALTATGPRGYVPPHRVRLEIDGQHVRDLPLPQADLVKGQVPLTFKHRFTAAGSHLVSVVVEPDPPLHERPADFVSKDWLPADNRQDVAVEVAESLPVLLVEADDTPSPRASTFYLYNALAELRDPKKPSPAWPRVVPLAKFTPDLLTLPLDPARPASVPRVLVLADVPRLTDAQRLAVGRFLAAGGGVLVAPGPRVEAHADHYNDDLHRGGQGWLPARLDGLTGVRTKPDQAAVQLHALHHPALHTFREPGLWDLDDARFPRRWRLTPTGTAAPAALLTTGEPLLVEGKFHNGRVLVSAVPLDDSWDSKLYKLSSYSVLVHELLFYLAGSRSAQNVNPGQPLSYRLAADPFTPPVLLLPHQAQPAAVDVVLEAHFAAPAAPGAVTARLQRLSASPVTLAERTPPAEPTAAPVTARLPYRLDPGSVTPLSLQAYPAGRADAPLQRERAFVLFEHTHAPGVYRWRDAASLITYATVQPDPREYDLTPCTAADRARVAQLVPLTYGDAAAPDGAAASLELWWLGALLALLLLGCESWWARRLARSGN